MVNAAQKEIEENPGKASPELLSDFQTLLDIADKIETVVITRMEQGQEIDLETLAVTVEKTVKKGMVAALSPASLDKLKGGVLYSMQIDDSITEEQAKVFIREGNLDTKERAIAIEYLKRIKNIKKLLKSPLSINSSGFLELEYFFTYLFYQDITKFRRLYPG
jgi:hypothetical protein